MCPAGSAAELLGIMESSDAFPWSPTSLLILTSDTWHQTGVFLHTISATVSFLGLFFVDASTWLSCGITVRYSGVNLDWPVWHQLQFVVFSTYFSPGCSRVAALWLTWLSTLLWWPATLLIFLTNKWLKFHVKTPPILLFFYFVDDWQCGYLWLCQPRTVSCLFACFEARAKWNLEPAEIISLCLRTVVEWLPEVTGSACSTDHLCPFIHSLIFICCALPSTASCFPSYIQAPPSSRSPLSLHPLTLSYSPLYQLTCRVRHIESPIIFYHYFDSAVSLCALTRKHIK